MAKEIDPKLIEQRAYQIWEQEGRPHGRSEEHWSEARVQLEAETDYPDVPADEFGNLQGDTIANGEMPPHGAKPLKPSRTAR